MNRVSSRPRLVSDSDRAFQNATIEGEIDIDFPEQDPNDDEFAFSLGESASFRDLTGLQEAFREKSAIVVPPDNGAASSKRKRHSRSQRHPSRARRGNTAPRSAAAAPNDGKPSPPKPQRVALRLDSMPAAEETLVLIASFIRPDEVRTGLAATCRRLRAPLATGRGAAVEIWGEALRRRFPHVLPSLCLLGDVTFVDDYRLPIPGVAVADGCVDTNLPLLTGLLPRHYPCAIDLATLRHEPFRSFHASIAGGGEAALVPVVQFTGRVGQGDRCIRSGRPFPRSRTVSPDVDGASDIDSAASYGGGFGGGLSLWMKKHAPRGSSGGRRGGYKNRRAMHDGAPPSDGTPRLVEAIAAEQYSAMDLLLLGTQVPLSQALVAATTTAGDINRRAPLYRFVASLTRSCGDSRHSLSTASSSSSTGTGDATADDHDDSQGIADNEREDAKDVLGRDEDDNHNNYGMPVLRRNLFYMCKRRLGDGLRRRRRHSRDGHGGVRHRGDGNELCPFVVPTVVAHGGKDIGKGRCLRVVDLTPRLVHYFEVTIVKPPDSAARGTPPDPRHGLNMAGQRSDRRWQPPRAGNYGDGRGRGLWPPPPLRPPHRVVPPLVNLPLLPPLPRHEGAPSRPPRHECVAIGLSVAAFAEDGSVAYKMPGWDRHSYGYHGDDGGIFHGRGDMLRRYGPTYGPGDTVGCGLEHQAVDQPPRVFFTVNGRFLGYAFDGTNEELYPTVGVDTECPVFVNFGERPFVFDLRGFARKDDCEVNEDWECTC